MGSDFGEKQLVAQEEFQSTLPHGERRVNLLTGHVLEHISIHAPAWGATFITDSITV